MNIIKIKLVARQSSNVIMKYETANHNVPVKLYFQFQIIINANLYKISVYLIENVSLKRNESFLLNKIINNKVTKMFFCAALVLLFIVKLRFPKGKNIHHIMNII